MGVAPQNRLKALKNYSLGSYGALSTLPGLTRNLLSHLVPCDGPACQELEEREAWTVPFTILWLLEAHAGLDELVVALVDLGSAAKQLKLVYTTMARYMEELEQKLEEKTESIGRELMEYIEDCAHLW